MSQSKSPVTGNNTALSSWSEEERLSVLDRYQILDSLPEEDFDDIAKLAALICGTPVSLISFVDRDRQWFKAKVGTDLNETPLDVSFCKHTMLEDEILVVPDATKDKRFVDNALVTDNPHIRFYAGATLRTEDGFPLGSICVIDTEPRELSDKEAFTLKILARQAMKLLELRRALKEKQVSDERLHFALDTSAIIGTWDWDMQSDLVYSDARFAEMFSLDPDKAEDGIPISEFLRGIHPDDIEHVSEKIKRAVETAGEFAEEYRLLSKDGSVRWIFAHGHSYSDENGKPARFPGAAVDVTEKKRTERKQAALVELSDRLSGLRTTADITGVAAEIMGRTLDGIRAGYGKIDDTGNFIVVETDWTNGIDQSMAGVHHFRDYGTEFAESVKRGEVIVINDILEDTRTSIAAGRFDKVNIRSLINVSLVENGMPSALFYIHDSKPRVWRRGEIQLVKHMAQRTWAMAERIRAEEQMQEALVRAEEANIAKTEFLANMSHEIRTPMNAIIGLSSILSNEKLTPRQQEFVRTLQMSADSLLVLINDLLDISKIEARTIELENIPFNLGQMMQEVISMMTVKAREKDLAFTIDASSIEGRIFIGDPTRLRQIFVNLCSNAIKFTDQGSVTVSITPHAIDGETDRQNICITVADTGIGIAHDKVDSIFEKFIQADNSINRKYGGTGLGLAITKTLVGLMGGTIDVQSDVGRGAVFTVCVPLQTTDNKNLKTEEEYKMSTAVQLENSNSKKILLVEDYAPNVLVAGTFLEEFGYEWDSAKSGAEAVEKALKANYAAILMDVQMFGMNGLEATTLIREHEKQNKARHVPIIGMTAHALSGDRERCISVGMDEYISKPFNPDELREKLETLTKAA